MDGSEGVARGFILSKHMPVGRVFMRRISGQALEVLWVIIFESNIVNYYMDMKLSLTQNPGLLNVYFMIQSSPGHIDCAAYLS